MKTSNPWALVLLSALLLTVAAPESSLALNEPTHRLVNREAATSSQLDDTLRSTLGIKEGVLAGFRDRNGVRKDVLDWLGEGGIQEDEGKVLHLLSRRARYTRHFHDPLQSWDAAGLSVPILGRFESSVRWMQRTGQGSQAVGGDWSWGDARRHYWYALISSDPGTREREFADTFRALGQLMHLVTDASVPEHTRNDVHPLGALFGSYEYWASAQHGGPGSTAETNFILDYLSRPLRPDPAILQQGTGDSLAPVPVARLIDTDTYLGLSTGPNVTLGPTIGIAEVANANFFSEDTGSGPSPYPFPNLATLERVNLTAPTGRTRAYFNKGPNDGLAVAPVLAECVLFEPSANEGVDQPIVRNCMDGLVWSKVADQMLPRAVGYSAALLDYFFRGRLTATLRVYQENGALHAEVRITNLTPDEDMQGRFEMYYDLPSGTRQFLKGWDLMLGPASSAIAQSEPLRISPLPTDTPPTAWTLVFKGRLGVEEDAVAAARMGSRYVGSVISYTPNVREGSAISLFRDASRYEPEPPFLIARDTITLTAWGGPVGGIQGVTNRFEESYVYYPDPTSTRTRVEIVASPWSLCGGYDSVWYGLYSYRSLFNHFEYTPTSPSSADLVELEPPDTLAELFGYEATPPVSRVLMSAIGPGTTAGPIDITGVRMLGLVLTTGATEPPVPEMYPEGYPQATSVRQCVARVDLRLLD